LDDWNNYIASGAASPTDSIMLTGNIGDSILPVTQMFPGTFSGHLNGDGFKIYVQIVSNDSLVGLFSLLDGANVHHLIIDGSVIGGTESRYVGALAGQITNSYITHCLNLADVTGESPYSSVGGFAGEIFTA